MNDCRLVHVFALAMFRSAVIVPDVVTGVEPIVREPEDETPTEVTVPEFCVRQLPEIEKQPPLAKLIPPVVEKVEVPRPKFMPTASPPTESRLPGVVEEMPRLPEVRILNAVTVDVAYVSDDEAM